ncbi:MAG: hypothetical protein SFV19_04705 [Rhodospirillaceae bacterium]|nr:hypothetical protein [Rhodospirillaceae bacterium]
MTIYCLRTRGDGTTTIVPISLHESQSDPFRVNLPTGAGATLVTGRRERQGAWHTTPKLGITVILEGFLDIEVNRAAPERTTLKAGDVLIVLDQTGDGHRSRAHGPRGMTALLLPLDAADLPALARHFRDWPAEVTLAPAPAPN